MPNTQSREANLTKRVQTPISSLHAIKLYVSGASHSA